MTPTHIVNLKYGWLSGPVKDHAAIWSVRLGRAVFVAIAVGLVYLELRLNHIIGG